MMGDNNNIKEKKKEKIDKNKNKNKSKKENNKKEQRTKTKKRTKRRITKQITNNKQQTTTSQTSCLKKDLVQEPHPPQAINPKMNEKETKKKGDKCAGIRANFFVQFFFFDCVSTL